MQKPDSYSIKKAIEKAQTKARELMTMILDFNEKSSELTLIKVGEAKYSHFTPQRIEEIFAEEKEKHLTIYKNLVDKFQKEVSGLLSEILLMRESFRFPLRTSKDMQEAQLGELKKMSAQSYFGSKKSVDSIRLEILQSYRLDDFDYFNSLIDLLLLQDDPESRDIVEEIKNIYKQFAEKNGIGVFEDVISSLIQTSNDSNQFYKSIEGQHLYFFTKDMSIKLGDESYPKYRDGIISSSQYWETQLGELKYIHQIV